jgi:hypothetical protein
MVFLMQISLIFQSYAASTRYLIPVSTSKTPVASSDSGNITTQISVIYILIAIRTSNPMLYILFSLYSDEQVESINPVLELMRLINQVTCD